MNLTCVLQWSLFLSELFQFQYVSDWPTTLCDRIQAGTWFVWTGRRTCATRWRPTPLSPTWTSPSTRWVRDCEYFDGVWFYEFFTFSAIFAFYTRLTVDYTPKIADWFILSQALWAAWLWAMLYRTTRPCARCTSLTIRSTRWPVWPFALVSGLCILIILLYWLEVWHTIVAERGI